MFNPYKHLRLAACVVFLLAQMLMNLPLVILGFILMLVGVVGGLDLTERRVELLEKILLKEKDDAKTETPQDN